MNRLKRVLFLVGLPLLLVAIWWASTLGARNFYVPTPSRLAKAFWTVWAGERFWTDLLPSVARLVVGLTLSIFAGIGAGMLIGTFRQLRCAGEPVLEFFRAVPPPVLVPLLMLIVGINDEMKVLVIFSGAVWPVLLNTVEGVRAVDSVLSDNTRIFGVVGLARMRYLVLPAALPQIMAGVRQCLSIGLILMVISEMFASSSGLGFTIVYFQRTFAIPEMWSGILVLGLIGIAFSVVFEQAERHLLRWYRGLKVSQREF